MCVAYSRDGVRAPVALAGRERIKALGKRVVAAVRADEAQRVVRGSLRNKTTFNDCNRAFKRGVPAAH